MTRLVDTTTTKQIALDGLQRKGKFVSLDEDTSEFTAKSTFDHPYPTTKIMWIPDSKVLY